MDIPQSASAHRRARRKVRADPPTLARVARLVSEKFRVTGTLLAEAYSSPPGAFPFRGTLTMTADCLRVRESVLRHPRVKLDIPFASVRAPQLAATHLSFEWDAAGDGVISALRIEPASPADGLRLMRALARRLPVGD
jgi:hypothetical protein